MTEAIKEVLEAWSKWEDSMECPCVCDDCQVLSDALSKLAKATRAGVKL